MPLITLHTNASINSESSLLAEMTDLLAAQLEKPASVTMARCYPNTSMSMGGDATTHCALFEIEGIELSPTHALPLTQALSALAYAQLNAPAERVFIKLHDIPRGMWGGHNKVF